MSPDETSPRGRPRAGAAGFVIVVCFEDAGRARFLLVRHEDRGWELPGGRIEGGESPEAAAGREFAEETGHRLEGARLAVVQDRPRARCWVFAGLWGPSEAGSAPRARERIVESRFVRRLGEVAPLSFPLDPYDEIGRAVGHPLRQGA